MRDRLALTFILALLLALSLPAAAMAVDGTITGLDISPSPAAPNQSVTITVLGTEKCKMLEVDFGDQGTLASLENVDFTDNDPSDGRVGHTYGSPGTYTVTASPMEQCSGIAQKTLTVEANGGGPDVPRTLGRVQDHLCAILDNCPVSKAQPVRMMRLDPRIDSIFLGPIKPGAKVMLFGRHFGRQDEPRLKLHLETENLTVDVPLFDWSKTMVAGTIPAALSGVHDQPAEFEVIRADNKPSNRYGVTFTAIHEVKQLEQSDVRIVQCPSTSNCDRCNSIRHDGCAVQSAFEDASVVGSHRNCSFCVGDDHGTDIYEITLKNGWVIEDYDYTGYHDPSEASLSMPSSAPLGTNTWKPKIKWSATPSSGLHYWVRIYVEGPRGLPYR